MTLYNHFLRDQAEHATKGGPQSVEDPRHVENIVFQTRAGALEPFEARLAQDLMDVFGHGAEGLHDVVTGLNKAGSLDLSGKPWTDDSFTQQMAASAAATFAPATGAAGDE